MVCLRLTAFAMAIFISACFGKADFMKQSESDTEKISISALNQDEGVYKAAFVAELHRDQTLLVSDSEIGNTEITIPGGALAVAMNISVQEGVNLATQSLQSDLNLDAGTEVTHSGKAINIMGDANVDMIEPMTIAIDLPEVSSLRLDSSDLYPTVLYHVVRHGDGGTVMKGVFSSKEVTLKGKQVVFGTKYFGTFQAVYLNKPVESKVEILVEESILNRQEEAKLPEVRWSIGVPSLELQTLIVTAQLEGHQELSRCKLFLDDDMILPWIHTESVSSPGVYKISIAAAWSGLELSASFECVEKSGRILRSEWSDAVGVPKLAPQAAPSSSSGPTNSPATNSEVEVQPTVTTPALSAAFSINNQQAFTATQSVSLSLGDATSVTHYRAANETSANCSAAPWQIYQGAIAHLLSAGDGVKTVCLQVKNSAGLESAIESDSIVFDSTAPETTAFSINGNQIRTSGLIVSISLDSTVGVADYLLANDTDCGTASWQPFVSSPLSHTLTSGEGLKTVCMQVRDEAGNMSSLMTETIILDQTGPVISFLQNAVFFDANTTAGSSTDFGVTIADAGGVAGVAYSIYDETQQKYFDGASFTATQVWLNASGSGLNWNYSLPDSIFIAGLSYTISVRSSDNFGNQGLADKTIIWANVAAPPTPASLSVNYEHAGLHLNWTPSSNPGQNIEGYLLVRKQGAAVAWAPTPGVSYTAGENVDGGTHTVVYVGLDHRFSDSPLNLGANYHYAMYAFDVRWAYSPAKIANGIVRKTIYRSVEVGATTALAVGTDNPLDILDSVASFAVALPDHIGVGDALEYDDNNLGSVNKIVFITKRISATEFLVKDKLGANATITTSFDEDWKIHRAYTTLYNAEMATENLNINSSLRNFDGWTGGRDLVSNQEAWHIALYKSTSADTTRVVFQDWMTSDLFYLRLFSPQLLSDVGESQRNVGVYSTAHYRLETPGLSNEAALMMTGYANHVRIEGLQIFLTSADGNGNAALALWPSSDHRYEVVGNIIKGSEAAGNEHGNIGVEIWDYLDNSPTGDLFLVNNIIYNFTNEADPALYVLDAAGISLYSENTGAQLFNNTIYNCTTAGILKDASVIPTPVSRNNIILATHIPMKPLNQFTEVNNVVGTAPIFVDLPNKNFLLDPSDTVAANGTNLAGNADYPFFFDILGNPRGFGPWSIGAHQP